jgi:hypothetical protein
LHKLERHLNRKSNLQNGDLPKSILKQSSKKRMKKIKNIGNLFVFIFFSCLMSIQVSSQVLNKTEWTVLSEDNIPVESTDTLFLGKTCMKLDSKHKAIAWNKDIHIENFRIDADIAGAVMSGIGFRVKDEQNYQFLYFRPGYGGTEEAIQYIPIYNGALSWVFYGAYQDTADIKRLEWFHTSIEVRGNNLKVFANYKKKPDMDITMLQAGAKSGSVLLRTMFGDSYFANISIRELPAYITDWEISEQMPTTISTDYTLTKKVSTWTKINEDNDRYVNLCRYFQNPTGTVIARHIIHEDSVNSKLLRFDFTGKMSVWLNGRAVFFYDKYKLDRVEEDKNSILLNLKKGDNELLLVTQGDGFIFGKGYKSMGRLQHQNWGFIAGLLPIKL